MAAVEGIGGHQFIYIWVGSSCLKSGLDHDLLDQIKFQPQGFYFGLQIRS